MKRFLSLLLAVSMLVVFGGRDTSLAEDLLTFTGMNDDSLTDYIEDTLYSTLVSTLDSDDYFVENVQAVYVSQEYIDELAYNSQANVFFGYTLEELNQQFDGAKYIFTLGDNNATTVEPWEDYDDTYEKIIQNVAVGTGVIMVCVTVSVVSGGAAVSMIFAVAAKSATVGALSGAALGGVSAGIVTGIQTGDMDEAMKSAALAASEGFKWGAISGAISGGVSEYQGLRGATCNGLSMNDAAAIQKESGYPLDVIKTFKTKEQYEICKEAGLKPTLVNNKTALIRKIDLDYTDEYGRTNLERMKEGLAALDPATGKSYQLHHIGQKMDSTLAILTEEEHMQGGNNAIWHEIGKKKSEIDRGTFDKQREAFWKKLAEILTQ
jgi:hypothetical protein